MSSEQILSTFYQSSTYKRTRSGWTTKYRAERWRGVKPTYDLVDVKTGKVVADAGKKIAARLANKLVEDGVADIQVPSEDLFDRFIAEDIVSPETGVIYVEAGVSSGAAPSTVYPRCLPRLATDVMVLRLSSSTAQSANASTNPITRQIGSAAS